LSSNLSVVGALLEAAVAFVCRSVVSTSSKLISSMLLLSKTRLFSDGWSSRTKLSNSSKSFKLSSITAEFSSDDDCTSTSVSLLSSKISRDKAKSSSNELTSVIDSLLRFTLASLVSSSKSAKSKTKSSSFNVISSSALFKSFLDKEVLVSDAVLSCSAKSKSKSSSLLLLLSFVPLTVDVDKLSASAISSSMTGAALVAAGSSISCSKSSKLSAKSCSLVSKSLEFANALSELAAKSFLYS